MDKSTKKLDVIEKTTENENQQEIVPDQIDSDNSEDENEDIQSHIKALPNSSSFSRQLTITLVALMQSSKIQSIKSTPFGARIPKPQSIL